MAITCLECHDTAPKQQTTVLHGRRVLSVGSLLGAVHATRTAPSHTPESYPYKHADRPSTVFPSRLPSTNNGATCSATQCCPTGCAAHDTQLSDERETQQAPPPTRKHTPTHTHTHSRSHTSAYPGCQCSTLALQVCHATREHSNQEHSSSCRQRQVCRVGWVLTHKYCR